MKIPLLPGIAMVKGETMVNGGWIIVLDMEKRSARLIME